LGSTAPSNNSSGPVIGWGRARITMLGRGENCGKKGKLLPTCKPPIRRKKRGTIYVRKRSFRPAEVERKKPKRCSGGCVGAKIGRNPPTP